MVKRHGLIFEGDKDTYFKIYPNPFAKCRELNIMSSVESEVFKVFNYTGSLLVTKMNQPKEITLNLTDFKAGIYIFQPKMGTGWYF